MSLSAKEFKAFDEFVRSLYIPQSESGLRRTIARGILNFIPGDNAVGCSADLKKAITPDSVVVKPLNYVESFNRLMSNFPDRPMFLTMGLPNIDGHYALSDLISGVEEDCPPSDSDATGEKGTDDEWVLMEGDPYSHLNITVILRKKRGFTRKDHEKTEMLVPHLKQAFKNARHFDSAIPLTLASQARSELTEGMILLDEKLQITHCSDSTRERLNMFFEAGGDPNRLPKELEFQIDILRCPRLEKVMGEQTLEIHFYQDQVSKRSLLTTRLIDSQAEVARLKELGLSPRETEVLHWISQGKRNEEIGIILKLSIFTVKTHIKSIFQRLGVETRTAAAAVAKRSSKEK